MGVIATASGVTEICVVGHRLQGRAGAGEASGRPLERPLIGKRTPSRAFQGYIPLDLGQLLRGLCSGDLESPFITVVRTSDSEAF